MKVSSSDVFSKKVCFVAFLCAFLIVKSFFVCYNNTVKNTFCDTKAACNEIPLKTGLQNGKRSEKKAFARFP